MDPFRVLSIVDFDSDRTGCRRRLKHTKVTTGCIMCKVKRVKASQQKPNLDHV